jgi:hypothetical protein
MFRSLAVYFTRKAVEKQTSTRKTHFLNWDKIEKIALILDNREAINKSELDKFIERSKKYVDVFFLELNSKNGSFGDWICFTKKDKSILGLPKSHVDSSLKNRNYQLVINAAEKYELFSADIVSKINSPYNCGCQNLFGETDLIIEKNQQEKLMAYLEQVVRYLQMIRPNT